MIGVRRQRETWGASKVRFGFLRYLGKDEFNKRLLLVDILGLRTLNKGFGNFSTFSLSQRFGLRKTSRKRYYGSKKGFFENALVSEFLFLNGVSSNLSSSERPIKDILNIWASCIDPGQPQLMAMNLSLESHTHWSFMDVTDFLLVYAGRCFSGCFKSMYVLSIHLDFEK